MFTLLIGFSLPWIAGCVWTAWLIREPSPARKAIVLGYGFLIGSLALTLWMRALGVAGLSFTWISVGVPMLLLTAMGAFLMTRHRVPDWAPAAVPAPLLGAGKMLWWLFALLICAHLVMALVEVVTRPLFPWDAWTQWATKARVWFELQRMVPFADTETWFGGSTYTDAAPGYPANVPLLQVWTAMSFGRWDDGVMNLSSVAFATALVLAFYGQLRHAGCPALLAMFGTYALSSLPFVDTHVALAGYADFPLAVYYGLAAIALWQWTITRQREQAVFAVILALACPLTKNPGWLWLLTLLPALVITLAPKRGVRIVVGLGIAAVLLLVALSLADVTIFTYHVQMAPDPVLEPLWQNYFEFANWHLLWYLAPVIAVLGHQMLLTPKLVAGTAMVGTGLAFLFLVFSFSSAAAWVTDFSTVNRATLHIAPLLVFFCVRVVQALFEEWAERRSAQVEATASTSTVSS